METAPPLVSVIMPCFNAGPMLRPALLSVFEQSHPNIEIIFVDNNSTDGSADAATELARAHARSLRVVTCEVQGTNHARNAGYALAHGQYIQWMDADDRLDRDKVALQVAALQRHPEDDIAYGDWTVHRTEPGNGHSERRKNLHQVDDQLGRTLAGIWYPPHLYLLRREAAERLQDVQAWWPERKVATDIEYSALAALLGLRFRYAPGAHVQYNIWSTSQISGSTAYLDRLAALESIFRRLREFVRAGRAKVSLDEGHRLLLNQSWDALVLPRGSAVLVELPGGGIRLRQTSGGKEIALAPHEVTIAKAIAALSRPLSAPHIAVWLMEAVPALEENPVPVFAAIERLRREGFLRRTGGEPTK